MVALLRPVGRHLRHVAIEQEQGRGQRGHRQPDQADAPRAGPDQGAGQPARTATASAMQHRGENPAPVARADRRGCRRSRTRTARRTVPARSGCRARSRVTSASTGRPSSDRQRRGPAGRARSARGCPAQLIEKTANQDAQAGQGGQQIVVELGHRQRHHQVGSDEPDRAQGQAGLAALVRDSCAGAVLALPASLSSPGGQPWCARTMAWTRALAPTAMHGQMRVTQLLQKIARRCRDRRAGRPSGGASGCRRTARSTRRRRGARTWRGARAQRPPRRSADTRPAPTASRGPCSGPSARAPARRPA